MKKSKGSTFVDCLYMEFILNKHNTQQNFKCNAVDSKTFFINWKQKNCKQIKQLVKKDSQKDQQQMIIEFTDNKMLTSKLYQPMVIHSHRVIQNNKNSTIESPKFKRSSQNINIIQKKEVNIYRHNNNKPWHPHIRMKRRQHIQILLEQKQSQEFQSIQGMTCFQPIGDLSGWQTQEDPQIGIE